MVILVQLLVFLLAVFIRGSKLFGRHLHEDKEHAPGVLTYKVTGRYGGVYERHVGVVRAGGIPFIVRREHWYHKILKALGLAHELQVGDGEFDRRYFIITDFPHHLEKVMRDGVLLGQVKQLLALPVKSLHATSGKVWCVIKSPDKDKPQSYFVEHLMLLGAIGKAARMEADGPVRTEALQRGAVAFGFLICHGALLTLGVLGRFQSCLMMWILFIRMSWWRRGYCWRCWPCNCGAC